MYQSPADEMRSLYESFIGAGTVAENHEDTAAVKAIKKWTDDLAKLLEKSSSVAASEKRALILGYANWVRAYGSFYKSVLKNNPGLAEVFKTIEDSLKIEVKIVGESFDITDITEDDNQDVGNQNQVDFILTLKEAVDKIPSTTLKQRFVYQFKRWERTTPIEMQRAERMCPTLYSLVREIMHTMDDTGNDPTEDDFENVEKDAEHLDTQSGEVK